LFELVCFWSSSNLSLWGNKGAGNGRNQRVVSLLGEGL